MSLVSANNAKIKKAFELLSMKKDYSAQMAAEKALKAAVIYAMDIHEEDETHHCTSNTTSIMGGFFSTMAKSFPKVCITLKCRAAMPSVSLICLPMTCQYRVGRVS